MQNNRTIGDAKAVLMAAAGSATDKPPAPLQPPLKCPRCDSSNTKFCYYNNYSLTQPRHFCKACKRYWTRGGTLRNVPVGGGCRKNKRVRRISSTSSPSSSGAAAAGDAPLLQNPILHASRAGSNPLLISPNYLYGVPAGNHINLNSYNGYDLYPQGSGALGLGLHPGGSQLGDAFGAASSNPLLSSYSSFGSSPSMASLAASSLQHQRFLNQYGSKEGDGSRSPNFWSFEGLNMAGRGTESEMGAKSLMKVEWNNGTSSCNSNSVPINDDQMRIGEANPGIYWNNASVAGANWSDFGNNNMGSSLTSLI